MLDESKSLSKLPTILLSILSGPFLVTIVTVESLTNSLIEAGKASEELFRGERLPILDPEAKNSNTSSGN
ncbi:hypothetical protein GLO73106DRAFT_00009100 [Gloeocapsa sp. PCC 73106]|nr:hypothetical protein GLO73106DRAFT_00009100 [Gloeocapsa sp. PCC 73106]